VLKLRVISAVVMLPLVLGSLWLPNILFALILAVFTLAAAWEWGRLIAKVFNLPSIFFATVYIAGNLLVLLGASQTPVLPVVLVAFIWWLGASAIIVSYPYSAVIMRSHAAVLALAGMLVLVPAWRALVELQSNQYGPQFILFFMILIWGADIAAYFVGGRWGKDKLAPHLSPGKSWQGVFGALATGAIIALPGAYLLGLHRGLFWFLIIALLTVSASILGDLLESILKREAGVKDSSHLIPGHGGMLDRIDSITAAAPVFLAFLLWLKV